MWQKLTPYALKLHLQQQPFPKTIIGIDFGTKSTGVAVTSSDLLHAFVPIIARST
jgi:molecular chaperone DnaK (HSP70)